MRGSDEHSSFFSHDHAAVLVEDVSCTYVPQRWNRLHRMFAAFGGIEAGVADAALLDDDDSDDDVGFEDMDDQERTESEAGTIALVGASLRVDRGECVVVFGSTGSGKSVLLRAIAGLSTIDSGRVVVHGTVVPILEGVLRLFPPGGKIGRYIPILWVLLRIRVRRARRKARDVFAFIEEPELAGTSFAMAKGKQVRKRLLYGALLVVDSDVVLIDLDLPIGPIGEKCRERLLELKQSGAAILIATRDVRSAAWIGDRVVTLEGGKVVSSCSLTEMLAEEAAPEAMPEPEAVAGQTAP